MKNYHIILCAFILLGGCKEKEPEIAPVDKPQISINDIEVQEGNKDNITTLSVTLSTASETNVIVSYSTLAGSAESGSDFIGIANEQLIFAPNETNKVIEITIKGDEIKEADESFDLLLLNPVNATLDKDRATITILNDDSEGTSSFSIPSDGYTTPLDYENYDLVWSDEFKGTEVNKDDWTFRIGNGTNGWGNNELQYYLEENTSVVENDYLVIEARQQQFGGYGYTSSRMVTEGKQEFKYGRVDIRAALPKGQGMWPALWMLGSNFSTRGWPACGEIDIMEIVGNEPATLHGTVHWDNNGQYASYGQSTSLNSGDFSQEFHVFSIIWNENEIRWLLDDVQYNVIDTTPSGLSEFRQEFFFIFNVAVGGNWPGSPNSSTAFPQYMIVDYIRVFQ